MKPRQLWTEEEEIKFRTMLKTTTNTTTIAAELGRSVQSIKTKIGMHRFMHFDESTDEYRMATIAADKAFQAAMRAAIEAGLERAPIGIYRPTTGAGAAVRILPAANSSGCSSPAALCAELGNGGSHDW